jgi:hypothetical protein
MNRNSKNIKRYLLHEDLFILIVIASLILLSSIPSLNNVFARRCSDGSPRDQNGNCPSQVPPIITGTPKLDPGIMRQPTLPLPGADPTPIPGADPTPIPGADPTPIPGADPTPIPGTFATTEKSTTQVCVDGSLAIDGKCLTSTNLLFGGIIIGAIATVAIIVSKLRHRNPKIPESTIEIKTEGGLE